VLPFFQDFKAFLAKNFGFVPPNHGSCCATLPSHLPTSYPAPEPISKSIASIEQNFNQYILHAGQLPPGEPLSYDAAQGTYFIVYTFLRFFSGGDRSTLAWKFLLGIFSSNGKRLYSDSSACESAILPSCLASRSSLGWRSRLRCPC
jgi:hypothetical protein